MHIYDELTYLKNTSLALGFFDGIHLGHRVVLKNAIHIAKENNSQSCAIIFKNHPSTILSKSQVEQILTLEEKLNMLEKIGLDNVVLLDFKDYCTIGAKDYLENILIKYFSPIAITTGFNHSFGYNKEGNSKFLRTNQSIYKYKYFEVPPFVVKNNIVSCSVIRNFLHLGNFQDANELLGYNFFIQGTVIKGEHIASDIGFPSANINYPEEKIKIPYGVYFVTINVKGKEYTGVLNHSIEPKNKTEVHIIDFNQNIYGEKIKISFIAKIRNQIAFNSTDKLKAQITRDIAFAEIYKYFLHNYN